MKNKSFFIFIFIFLSLIFIFKKNAFAYVNIGIMPYKIISTHNKKYSYIARGIPLLLSSSLTSNDIRIVRYSDLVSYIKDNNINFSSKDFLKLAKHFKINYLIFGRIIKIGDTFVLQSNIFSVVKDKIIYRNSIQALGSKFIVNDVNKLSNVLKKKIVSMHPPKIFLLKNKTTSGVSEAVGGSSMFIKQFAKGDSGLVRTAIKEYIIQAISTGKFLSNGIQTVVATRHRIILYNLSISGKLTKLAQYELSPRSNVIYVGFYRISKDRRALIITKAKLGIIISYMLVYKNDSLVKLTGNYNLFLRVMNLPGLGNVIVGQKPISVSSSGRYFNDYVIGQNSYPIGQFGGKTYVYHFDNSTDTLIETRQLTFYNNITLYGTIYGDVKGNGKNYLLALSNSGNLMIIDNKGKTIYTGQKTYGGSPLQVSVSSFGGDLSSTYADGLIYNIPAQIEGLYHNGKLEIIVLKNYKQAASLHNLNYYIKNSIFSLTWNKVGFYPRWEIKPVTGYSAGFSIFKEGNNLYLSDGIVETPGSIFTKPKSYIAIYKIEN